MPTTGTAYRDTGLPWFDFHQEGKPLRDSKMLAQLRWPRHGTAQAAAIAGRQCALVIARTIELGKRVQVVRDGVF